MQIIDVSELLGVRPVLLRFRRRGEPLEFALYPMIHLAEAAFYADVTERLKDCHIIVAEGVAPSIRARAIATSYTWAKDSSRLGLVLEKIDYQAGGSRLITRDLGSVPTGAPPRFLINPDYTADEFRRQWAGVPLWQRAMVLSLAPLYGIGMRLFGTRRFIASRLTTDEESEYLKQPDEDQRVPLRELMLDNRDKLLIGALESIQHRYAADAVVVGVVYGAGHMPAVIQGLWQMGYRSVGAEWMTAFTL